MNGLFPFFRKCWSKGFASCIEAIIPELAIDFPQMDFEVLRQLLGNEIDEREEKYGLNWHGKRQARRIALTPSTGTLRPCPEESVDWETTQNLMIEGDNLEVLKLLQKSYAGKVKLIYIALGRAGVAARQRAQRDQPRHETDLWVRVTRGDELRRIPRPCFRGRVRSP